MKLIIVLAIFVTIALIFFKYSKDKNLKKLFISLLSFAVVISLAVMGNLTRPVIPIYIAHIILVFIAWGALIVYILRGKYYWWLILSPIITIGLFLVLEFLTGSAHELV
jgi:hypothetical protein